MARALPAAEIFYIAIKVIGNQLYSFFKQSEITMQLLRFLASNATLLSFT